MERPLIEVKLPISGYTAHIVKWYSTGERDEIDRIFMEGANLTFKSEEGTEITGLSAGLTIKQRQVRVEKAVKKLTGENEVFEVTSEILAELPAEDTDVILENLPDAEKGKKKSTTS